MASTSGIPSSSFPSHDSDGDLLARNASLLEHLQHYADFQAAPPQPAGAADSETANESERYRSVSLVAEGGLGAVYFAEDRQLAREVAVKTLRSDRRNDARLRERFRLEAFVIGGLEHPGVVPIYSLGSESDGAPYYAMRLIRGESMAAAIQRLHSRRGDAPTSNGSRRLAFRNLLSRLATVCRTVAYAHGRGVVHRDIKPDNIMLGSYGETLVVDWGLAKLVPLTDSEGAKPASCVEIGDSTLPVREITPPSSSGPTELGAIIGTPAYMSPEQALGMHDRVGPASDIYSLGAVLFVLLTGRRPLDGCDFGEAIATTVLGKLPRPRCVRRGVDRALDAICVKALERRPEERYASASDMADDIEAYLADEPIQAWREPLAYRVRRFLRRHRSLVLSIGASLLLIIGLLAGGTALLHTAYTNERAAKEVAETQRNEAHDNLRTAMQTVDRFLTKVASDPRLAEGPHSALRRELLADAREFLEGFVAKRPEDSPLLAEWGRAHLRLAELADAVGDHEESKRWCREAATVFRGILAQDPLSNEAKLGLARTENRLGALAFACHDLDAADAGYASSLRLYDELLASHELAAPLVIEASGVRQNQAQLLDALGRPAEAEAAYRSALEALQRALSRDESNHDVALAAAEIATNLAIVLQQTRPEEASTLYATAAQLLEGRDVEGRSLQYRLSLARNRANQATLLASQPDTQSDAMQHFDAARAAYATILAANPDVVEYREEYARLMNNEATLLISLQRPHDAEAAFRTATEQFEMLLNRSPALPRYRKDHAGALGNLGALLLQSGRPDEARRCFEDEMALREGLAREFPSQENYAEDVATSRRRIAFLTQQHGSPNKAVEAWLAAASTFHDLAERFETNRDTHRLDELGAELVAAVLQGENGEPDEAIRRLTQLDNETQPLVSALAETEQKANLLSRAKLTRTQVLMVLATLQKRSGDLKTALVSVQEALAVAPPTMRQFAQLLEIEILASLGDAPAVVGAVGRLPAEAIQSPQDALQLVRQLASTLDPANPDPAVDARSVSLAITLLEQARRLGAFQSQEQLDAILGTPEFEVLRNQKALIDWTNTFSP